MASNLLLADADSVSRLARVASQCVTPLDGGQDPVDNYYIASN
jgi:hypothetical protein